jgi:hypothetical protein
MWGYIKMVFSKILKVTIFLELSNYESHNFGGSFSFHIQIKSFQKGKKWIIMNFFGCHKGNFFGVGHTIVHLTHKQVEKLTKTNSNKWIFFSLLLTWK